MSVLISEQDLRLLVQWAERGIDEWEGTSDLPRLADGRYEGEVYAAVGRAKAKLAAKARLAPRRARTAPAKGSDALARP